MTPYAIPWTPMTTTAVKTCHKCGTTEGEFVSSLVGRRTGREHLCVACDAVDGVPLLVQAALLAATDERASDAVRKAAIASVVAFAASKLGAATGDWDLRGSDQWTKNIYGVGYRPGPRLTVWALDGEEGIDVCAGALAETGEAYTRATWDRVSR